MNIHYVEALMIQAAGIEHIPANLFASLTWSFAIPLVSLTARLMELEKYPGEEDDKYEERVKFLERLIAENGAALAWAGATANPRWAANGTAVIEWFEKSDAANLATVASDAAFDAEYKALFGDDLDEVDDALAKDQAERAELQRATVALNRRELIAMVDAELNAFCPQDYELSTENLVKVLKKIALKCEQYEFKARKAARASRRKKILREKAAESVLLTQLMDQADELADRFQGEIDHQGPETPEAMRL